MWLGEVVRALGMLGLLLGMFYAGASVTNAVLLYNDPEFTSAVTWVRVFDVLPIVAFTALLSGRRTSAKIAAFMAAVVPAVTVVEQPGWVLWWALFQLPSIVTFVCLCLGFHREAPTPPARRLAWWGGGAVLLGLAGGLIGVAGLLTVVVGVVITRVVAYRRDDVVLGRALSLFAVLMLAPVALLAQAVYGGGRLIVPALVAAALLIVSAAAPVRRVRAPGFRLP
ncbi:hypothetical protein FXN61_21835 [Lentzea sp. PSKA42]|uniref:Uncharacterized protein n=1 Tax=Lentzea indica TaxID=2604800 RepID=A0ABX1FK54_9PSEU|nr:hypothetical protein [Lentzea indica]NKE59310.1 hypothetical protein [Lentzea indica]